MSDDTSNTVVLGLASDIVAAFVSNNTVRPGELPEVIAAVYAALTGLTVLASKDAPPPELKPAVPIKKSVTDDYIVSLENGQKFKSLRRHLQTNYGMTPDDYRAKWGLPNYYPMVAPGYAAKRSELARANGLGNSRRAQREEIGGPVTPTSVVDESPTAAEAPSLPAEQPDAAPKKRGRRTQKAA